MHLLIFGALVGGYKRRQDAAEVTVAGVLGIATTGGIPDARWSHLAFLLVLDVQASHDGLEDLKAGPSLDGLGLEIVDHRRSQKAPVSMVVVCVLLDPFADTYVGERATADVGLGATGRDALSERADELGRDARSERL